MSKAEQRTTLNTVIKHLATKFAPPKPPTPQIAGHTYFVGLCLGKKSSFYDIGRYYQLCTQHSKRGVKIDGNLCNKVDFITPALSKDELVELRGLWIRYDRLGTRYSKCGPAPDFLSMEAATSDDSSPSATPYPPSSSSIPFSSSPITPINKKRRHDTLESSFSPVSKRTKYFDLTRPRDQYITAQELNHIPRPSDKTIIDLTVSDTEPDTTPPPPSFTGPNSAVIIDLTVADTEVNLHGARASRRAEAQKRLASMTYLGSIEIDD